MLKNLKIGNTIFDFHKPYIMGILNVTPDSFSDGGKYLEPDKALKHIEKLIKDGADIIDIGAESTRPYSEPVTAEEEIKRLKPILTVYKNYFSIPLSLDTTKKEVAEFGLANGVDLINDISGLKFDVNLAETIKKYNVPIVLMHIKGKPKDMQQFPYYDSVVEEVLTELKKSCEFAHQQGINKIIIDPGIGFGKTLEHNLQLLHHIKAFEELNYPILIGTSKKAFLGKITNSLQADRLPETISSVIVSYLRGAHIFRVHDVYNIKKALDVAWSILNIKN